MLVVEDEAPERSRARPGGPYRRTKGCRHCPRASIRPEPSAAMDRSPEGRRVHQTASRPEIVGAAAQAERRVWPKIAIEQFGVVADTGDGAGGPLWIQTHLAAEIVGHTQKTLRFRIG